ncbi:sterol desaturase family protein [Adhaeribacter aquaticus]|uniref:sterol desaturase family protein n=1 Tax=Adhaeribacter aquaticus TaxID=299567 RepID=UPI0008FF009B|nr:sterol desaturase family protein [Adhaeribacter aquaticus]
MESKSFFLFYLVLTLRYLLIAGPAFLIFYILYKQRFSRLRIQKLFPEKGDYYREIAYSFLTFVFFSLIGVVLLQPEVKGHSQLYSEISNYGWGYFILSIFLALLLHDLYFYWTHRMMHHPKLFKLFHLTHHKSTNPSPWAAFAFSPLEAIVEGSIIFVIAFLIPIHQYAILAFLLIMTLFNVYGHLGYELYPKWLVKSNLGKWLNTSTNHNMHHKYFKGNYGLYTRIWDEVFKTTHADYDKTLLQLIEKAKLKSDDTFNQTDSASLSARKRTAEKLSARP